MCFFVVIRSEIYLHIYNNYLQIRCTKRKNNYEFQNFIVYNIYFVMPNLRQISDTHWLSLLSLLSHRGDLNVDFGMNLTTSLFSKYKKHRAAVSCRGHYHGLPSWRRQLRNGSGTCTSITICPPFFVENPSPEIWPGVTRSPR